MKQKTFQLDSKLAELFEDFCDARMLVEKRVCAAALYRFINASATEREEMILAYEDWHRGKGATAGKKARQRKQTSGSA